MAFLDPLVYMNSRHAMADWVMYCKKCSKTFVYSTIADTFANYFMPQKPTFGESGDTLECPHCHTKSVYRASDLRYQA